MSDPVDLPGYADVEAAAARIAPHAQRTPVLRSRSIDALAGAELHFKCENLQRVGAFKIRGATNAVRNLPDEVAARGVCTHSSGNHAQALALAARERGIPAWIVMPTTAPAVKRAAVEGYGATVVECEPTLAAREAAAARIVAETGAEFVHPYDDPRVIAGQATCAAELLEDVAELDALICPVGGGGLISGTCLAVAELAPHVRIFAAEPELASDAYESKRLGERQPAFPPRSVADGLLTSLGERTWPFVRDRVDEVLPVDESEIVAATRFLWERMKLVVEPSAATVAAAILRHAPALRRFRRVGAILTGGNVDLDRLPWLR